MRAEVEHHMPLVAERRIVLDGVGRLAIVLRGTRGKVRREAPRAALHLALLGREDELHGGVGLL